jgi:Holliday junction resolvasome RuvABC DNA-binding subunit
MVLELKDKIKAVGGAVTQEDRSAAGADHLEDAVSALVNLGYKKPLAEDALKKVLQGRPGLAIEERSVKRCRR